MRKQFLLYLILGLAVASAAAVVLYTNYDVVYAKLDALKLIPQQEHFTELYFNDASSLPSSFEANKSILFSFVIHNLEGRPVTYAYNVYYEDESGNRENIETNNIALAADQYKTVYASHIFSQSHQKGEVVVSLPEFNQDIRFILKAKE